MSRRLQPAPPRVLALDFDGVIWDSAGECFEVGWRAYQELFGRELSAEVYRQGFLAGRPLARTGHDFFLILKLLEEEPTRDLSEFPYPEFLQLREQQAQTADEFHDVFYRLRTRYRSEELRLWTSWQSPFQDMLAFVDRWEHHFLGAALATTKDTASAQSLLSTTGRNWPVFGKEFSPQKDRQMVGIAEHFGTEPESILFVDDLLENLEQVAPTGARTVLASWGYNTPESRREAQDKGYPVVDVEGLGELVEGLLGEVAR